MEQTLLDYSLIYLGLGAIALGLLAAMSLKAKKLTEKKKEILFFSIVAATMIPTLFVIFSTVYLNTTSSSGGPVHWHADIEIWACGSEINLRDPKGLSNKIGTATLHEHNDKRIHLEGLVMERPDANLGNFFKVIGGNVTGAALRVPTNEGVVSFNTGQTCPTGEVGEVQTFVYKTDKDGFYTQEKITSPAEYILSPESTVPHGDCIMVEFGPPKEKTDNMCRSYVVAEKIGKLKGERK